jgi:putative transport protein
MILLSLAAFVGMNGMQAGTHFVDAFKAQGVSLMLGGVAVTLSPLVSWVYFGRYVVKLNPIFILRACAGAQTVTAAMGGVQENRAAGHPLSVTRCRTRSDISCLPFGDPSFSHFLS